MAAAAVTVAGGGGARGGGEGGAGGAAYFLRFRTPQVDLGPFEFHEGQTVLAVKERLFESWPSGASLQPQKTGRAKGEQEGPPPSITHQSRARLSLPPPLPNQSTDGPLSKETAPASASELRLLCSGKLLDDALALRGVSFWRRRRRAHAPYAPTDADAC